MPGSASLELAKGIGAAALASGDDPGAKATVTGLLAGIGWPDGSVVDLGGIQSARGPEHYFLMFAALMQSLRTPRFNIRLVVWASRRAASTKETPIGVHARP
jgi:predicted dinucleotide-binding enzyme